MNNAQSSAASLKPGLTPVESRDDILPALVETEAECSSLAQELRLVLAADPSQLNAESWREAVRLLTGRADSMLQQLVSIRRVVAAG